MAIESPSRLELLRTKAGERWLLAAIWGGVLLALAYFYLVDPATYALHPPCPFHTLTGYHCPGCGSSRALHQLLHGSLGGALAYNPLAVVVLPYLIYSLLAYSLRVLRGRPLPGFLAPAWYIWAFLGAVIAFWILRNLPFQPFAWLAPG